MAYSVKEVIDKINIGFRAIGGDVWQPKLCECDQSVGSICAYCSIFEALRISKEMAWDKISSRLPPKFETCLPEKPNIQNGLMAHSGQFVEFIVIDDKWGWMTENGQASKRIFRSEWPAMRSDLIERGFEIKIDQNIEQAVIGSDEEIDHASNGG
jgi:hypothetical protein